MIKNFYDLKKIKILKKIKFKIKIFIFIALNIFVMKANSEEINYTFNYNIALCKENSCILNVIVEFKGSETSNTMIINLPNEPNFPILLTSLIKNIIISGATFENINDHQLKLANFSSGGNIKISYNVIQNYNGVPNKVYDIYAPILQPDYFHFLGFVLAYPDKYEQGKEKDLITFNLKWNLPSNWKVANSYGANNFHQQIIDTLSNLKTSLFIGGSAYRFRENIIDSKNKILTAIQGNWQFSDDDFNNAVIKIITYQRNYMQETGEPFLLVELSNIASIIPNKCEGLGGLKLNNSFMVFFQGNTCLIDNLATNTFAHEYFHKWIPGKTFIPPSDPKKSFYFNWFIEGFTNYYSSLIILRENFPTDNSKIKNYIQTYANDFNKVLEFYYTSPYVCYSVKDIQEQFWDDIRVQKFPYLQGEMIAHNWNSQIKKATSNQYSLDNLMQDMVKSGQMFHQEELIAFAYNPPYKVTDPNKDSQRISSGCTYPPKDERTIPIKMDDKALGPCFDKKKKRFSVKQKDGSTIKITVPQFQMNNKWKRNPQICRNWFGISN